MAKWEIIEDNKFKKGNGGKSTATRAVPAKRAAVEAAASPNGLTIKTPFGNVTQADVAKAKTVTKNKPVIQKPNLAPYYVPAQDASKVNTSVNERQVINNQPTPTPLINLSNANSYNIPNLTGSDSLYYGVPYKNGEIADKKLYNKDVEEQKTAEQKPKADIVNIQKKLNDLKKGQDSMSSLNGGLGPSNFFDALKQRDRAQEMGVLESKYQDQLQNTPLIDKADAVGTIMLTAGKYFAPPSLRKAIDYGLNIQDVGEFYNHPTDTLNQASVASDVLSYFKSKKPGKNPYGYVGDAITLKQKLDLFNNASKQTYKHGGIIEDPMGQWAHPGSVTRIPSNQITMQGVNYPVLGVSDRGHTQMMYPGKDYSFRGKSVTEYPMMAGGGEVNFTYAGENHRVYEKESPTGNGKGIEGHIMVNHPTENKKRWDTIDLTKITNGRVKTVAQGVASTKKWHKENPEYANGGKVVSEVWEETTGLPWSEAKKLGLTKGGYEENLKLRSELLKNPDKFTSIAKNNIPAETRTPTTNTNLPAYAPIEPTPNTLRSVEPVSNTVKPAEPVLNNTNIPKPIINNTNSTEQVTTNPVTIEPVVTKPVQTAPTSNTIKPNKFLQKTPNTQQSNTSPTTENNEKTETILPNTKNKEISAEEYQNQIRQNYKTYLEKNNYVSKNYQSPGVNTEHMNCIHGVCDLISGTTDVEWDSPTKTYTGNATFSDNASKEGFYVVDDVESSGYKVGDILQFSRHKDSKKSRFPGKITSKNKKDLYPNHAEVILDVEKDENGETWYTVANNRGSDHWDKLENSKISEKELFSKTKRGDGEFDGIIVNRYNPEFVKKQKEEKDKDLQILSGNNEYAPLYENVDKTFSFTTPQYDFNNKKVTEKPIKQAKDLLKIYEKNYSKIGKSSNLPPEILDEIIKNQLGIAQQETKFGTSLKKSVKENIPDLMVPTLRSLSSSGDDWVEKYWQDDAFNVQSQYKTKEDFIANLQKKNSLDQKTREWIADNSPRSKGIFQQKDLSKRGRYFDLNLNKKEDQALASLNLAIDNYHLLAKKAPNLGPDELLKLSTLMHNAPTKALTPEFVNYFLPNNDIDYVNKVDNFLKQGTFKAETSPKKNHLGKLKNEDVAGLKKMLKVSKNGGMIKRADGSYSQRGLWDNIRDNAGSGNTPTPEMLEQERKIKSQYANGGQVSSWEIIEDLPKAQTGRFTNPPNSQQRHLITAKDWQDINKYNYGDEEIKVRNADPNKYDIYRIGDKFELVPKKPASKPSIHSPGTVSYLTPTFKTIPNLAQKQQDEIIPFNKMGLDNLGPLQSMQKVPEPNPITSVPKDYVTITDPNMYRNPDTNAFQHKTYRIDKSSGKRITEPSFKNGGLYRMQDAGKAPSSTSIPVTDNTKAPSLSALEYQTKIKEGYLPFLEKNKYVSKPYVDKTISTEKGNMNCIHGVCDVISETTGKTWDSPTKTYIGNATFSDNEEKEGYYKVNNLQETGFVIGDVLQYARKKGSIGSRFPGEVTPKNKNELYPNHAVLIVDKGVNEKGETYYTVLNNKGETKWKDLKKSEITEKELMSRAIKGYETYDGMLVNRYDPEYTQKQKEEKEKELSILKGNNENAKYYTGNKTFNYEEENIDPVLNTKSKVKNKKVQDLVDIYNKNYNTIGKSSDLEPFILDELIKKQIGIAFQETKIGKDLGIKQYVPDSLVPTLRKFSSSGDDWVEDYWRSNAFKVQEEYKTKEDFIAKLNKNKVLDKETQNWIKNHSPRSQGTFQQKELSTRGRYFDLDLSKKEQQPIASLNLAIDNYHLLSKKMPNLSPTELIDLTTLMHNAPSKALTPEFVNKYLQENNIDYVNKVNAFEKNGSFSSKEKPLKQKLKKKEVEDIQKMFSKQNGGKTKKSNWQIIEY